MPLKDANQASEPSAEANRDAGTTNQVDGADANSSDATGEAEGSEVLNIVRDVVDEKEPEPEASASPAEGDGTGEVAGDTPPKKEPDDVNFTDVPFHKHPRFQQLVRKLKSAEGDAARHRNVQTFLDTHGLGSDEAANALMVFAQAKTDPIGAWNAIKPWVQSLLVAAGEVIPDDLKARVDAGELTREAAQEIGRHRAKADAVVSTQKFRDEQARRQAEIELGDRLVSTAQSWENDRRVKDPNFEAKLEPLQKEVAWLQQKEGKPTTPEGVMDQLNRAYKVVNEQARAVAPKPDARRPALRPVMGGQVAQSLGRKPTSTLDIIRANRRQA